MVVKGRERLRNFKINPHRRCFRTSGGRAGLDWQKAFSWPPAGSEEEADRENGNVAGGVKSGHGDLESAPGGEAEPMPQTKPAEHEAGVRYAEVLPLCEPW